MTLLSSASFKKQTRKKEGILYCNGKGGGDVTRRDHDLSTRQNSQCHNQAARGVVGVSTGKVADVSTSTADWTSNFELETEDGKRPDMRAIRRRSLGGIGTLADLKRPRLGCATTAAAGRGIQDSSVRTGVIAARSVTGVGRGAGTGAELGGAVVMLLV